MISRLVAGIWGAISTANANAATEAAAYDAAVEVGEQSSEKQLLFDSHAERAMASAKLEGSTAKQRIWTTSDASDLGTWRDWLAMQIEGAKKRPSVSDLSLCRALMSQWLLQRAGDDRSANQSTNSVAYAKARNEMFGLGKKEGLERPDLFVHQARYEWSRLGLTGVESQIALLEKEVLAARAQKLEGKALAANIEARLGDNRSMFAGSNDPEHTLKLLSRKNVVLDYDDVNQPIRCVMFVESRQSSVFAKRFLYFKNRTGAALADWEPGE